MKRLMLWLAGADLDTLRECRTSRRAESTRLAALGALVAIPAVLGLVSMSYAVSTIEPNPLVAVIAGAVWSGIVLSIDRYLVITMLKRSATGRRHTFSLAVLVRYVFAVFVGIAVAHPFVMLWFDDSITQQLAGDRQTAISVRHDQAEKDRAAVRATVPAPQSPALLVERQKQVDYQNCLTTLQQFEQSNAPKMTLPCGATTGIPTCARRCQDISPRIAAAARDVERLDAQVAAARATEAADQGRVAPLLADIDSREAADIARLSSSFSFDYLARIDALGEIEAKHPEVAVIAVFILIFFVIVDVLPVTMKLSARAGAYDIVAETKRMRVDALETAMQGEIADGWAERELARATVEADLDLSMAEVLSQFSERFFTFYTEQKIAFVKAVGAFRSAYVAPGPGPEGLESQLARLQTIDDAAWEKAMQRITRHLDDTTTRERR